MFEAKIDKAATLKKIVEAVKELVTDAKFECTSSGVSLQAMDASHVSLVQLLLRADGFEDYRCDRNISLGMNLESLSKVLKCAGNDDVVTMRAEDDADSVTFIFEAKSASPPLPAPQPAHQPAQPPPFGLFSRAWPTPRLLLIDCFSSFPPLFCSFSVMGSVFSISRPPAPLVPHFTFPPLPRSL